MPQVMNPRPSNTVKVTISRSAVLLGLERVVSECFGFGCCVVGVVAAVRGSVCMVISDWVEQVTDEVSVPRPRKSMSQYEVPPGRTFGTEKRYFRQSTGLCDNP